MQIFTTVNDMLGPIGLIAVLGILGLMMVATTVIMMLRQPEDPLAKLKRRRAERQGIDVATSWISVA